MEKQNIRIKLRAYDNKILDASTEEIVNTVKRTGANVKALDKTRSSFLTPHHKFLHTQRLHLHQLQEIHQDNPTIQIQNSAVWINNEIKTFQSLDFIEGLFRNFPKILFIFGL